MKKLTLTLVLVFALHAGAKQNTATKLKTGVQERADRVDPLLKACRPITFVGQ